MARWDATIPERIKGKHPIGRRSTKTVQTNSGPSHSACQSKNQAMRSKELFVELRSGEGYQNISAALTVPKNTLASIILKGKKFGTNKTLPGAGCPAKLSNQGRRYLVREVTNVHSDRAPEFVCGDGRTFQKDNHLCSTPPIRPDSPLGVCQKESKRLSDHVKQDSLV